MNKFEVGKIYKDPDGQVLITQIKGEEFYYVDLPHDTGSEVDYFIAGSIRYRTLKPV